uniref:EF-hand domain-containing protein n=1 Tax=Macrostomum lignano TaxID=282301 RepID=A0A1I8G1J8_9PLAT
MEASAKANISKIAEALHSQTNFTKKECEHLLNMYKDITGGADDAKLDRNKFKDILHNSFGMTDDLMMDQVAFRAYDLNSDGVISRDEMFQLLKSTLIRGSLDYQPVEEDPDEGVRDLVEIVFKKFDTQKKGTIDYAQFKSSVVDEPLLLQALGACLPDEKTSILIELNTAQSNGSLATMSDSKNYISKLWMRLSEHDKDLLRKFFNAHVKEMPIDILLLRQNLASMRHALKRSISPDRLQHGILTVLLLINLMFLLTLVLYFACSRQAGRSTELFPCNCVIEESNEGVSRKLKAKQKNKDYHNNLRFTNVPTSNQRK